MRKIHIAFMVICALALGPVAGADAQENDIDSLRHELEQLKRQFGDMRTAYEAQIKTLEQRLDGLESSKPVAAAPIVPVPLAQDDPFATTPAPVAAADPFSTAPSASEDPFATAAAPPTGDDPFSTAEVVAAPTARLGGNQGQVNWLQLGIDGLFAGGANTTDKDTLQGLQFGGHDPNRQGFTLQQVELSATAAVDPYFDANAFLVFVIDDAGNSSVEVEEAFLTTRALPGGLQIKAGQFFTEFGRHNHSHPHTWDFLDQPVVISRMFGLDSLRSTGARVSWLTPLPWFSELTLGTQNAGGETVTSFLANGPGETGDEEVGGHALIDRQVRNGSDLLYLARWLNGFDVSDTTSINIGLSGMVGPNSAGHKTDTTIFGADFFLKWQGLYATRGFPFFKLQSEVIGRRFQAGDPGDPTAETLKDWGLYAQALWGFRPGWVGGLRFDYADASRGFGRADDFLRDERKRISPNLTWYPSEFSKFRLQYNHDWADHLISGTADAIWLQFEFSIGSHLAHVF